MLLDKITGYMNKLSIHANNLKRPILWIVCTYLTFISFVIITLFVSWFVDWNYHGGPNIPIGLQFLDRLIGPGLLAVLTFLCGCLVDIDKDGIPDKFEGGSAESRESTFQKAKQALTGKP